MRELSLHLLDLVQNSVSAGASLVTVRIHESQKDDLLTISIIDDGCGMTSEFVEQVKSPFATTRKTRKVGLGIPMFMEHARLSGGDLQITSQVGKGTTLTATFVISSIDRPPLGDLPGTMITLILGTPEKPDYVLEYVTDEGEYVFDTREIRAVMDGIPLDSPEVIAWMREAIIEGLESCHGGVTL